MLIKLRIKPSALRVFPLTGRFSFGFSLIELLVVISIIAVLTAVLTANFMGMRERARDAQKIQDLYAIKSALRIYYNDHQSYPVSGDLTGALVTGYMPSLVGIGYTYTQINSDSFRLTVGLEAGGGTDDTDAQVKCGIDVGATRDKVFAVCGN